MQSKPHCLFETLLQSLNLPKKDPNRYNFKFFLSLTDFQRLSVNIVQVKWEQEGMNTRYISSTFIGSGNLCQRHKFTLQNYITFQAERDMLKHILAFDHQNYSWYLSYQHWLLNLYNSAAMRHKVSLKTKKHPPLIAR